MNRLSRTSRIFTRTISCFSLVLFSVIGIIYFVSLNQKVAHAATNSTINFQARILSDTGAVVADGTYNVQFKLYDVASGGAALWTETYAPGADGPRITTKNGYVTAALGTFVSFPGTINWDQQLYLTLNIGGTADTPDWDGEMDPRMKLTAVPYAFSSEKLQTYNGTIAGSLTIEAPTVGNQVFVIPDQAAAGTYNLCIAGSADCGFALGGAGDYIQNQNAIQQATSNFWISGTGRADTSFSAPLVLNGSTANNVLTIQGNSAAAGNTATNANIQFKVGDSGATTAMTILNNGNVGINTATPTSLLTIQGTTATDIPTYGSEFLDADNWTLGSGWSGDFASGFTHSSGTATLTHDHAAANATKYKITFTVTNRNTGSFNFSFGGLTKWGVDSSGIWGPTTTSTASLTITPTNDFDGKVVFSIVPITGTSAPIIAVKSSDSTTQLEVRVGTEYRNMFIGNEAGRYNITGYANVALGNNAFIYNTTGYGNIAVGANALESNTTASENTALGNGALTDATSGGDNTAVGYYALRSNTTGRYNAGLGSGALYYNTTGSYNSALGTALINNTDGYYNVALGHYAGYSSIGNSNIFLGYNAGYYETGSNKLFIDNQQRASEADGRTKALIYGVFDAAVANQSLTVNGALISTYGLTVSGATASLNTNTTVQVTNASALSVQSASAADTMFTVDTTNNQVKIGNNTGTGSGTTLLILDSASTSAGLATVNGAMYYDTTNHRIECYENGVWGNCADASLQEAYQSSVGATTPEILLDTTRYGLDIQDANTTFGNTVALFAIRGSATASTLGASLLQVNNDSNSPLIGIGLGSQAMSTGIDLQFGGSASRTIQVLQNSSAGTGRNLTVKAGQGNTGAGGQLLLYGGDGNGTNQNGGNVVVSGGTPTGSGVKGWVVIDTPAYATASTQDCGVNCTITQANIDSYGAVIINATATGLTATMPDPTVTTAGRVVYVTAALGSSDFTLSVNGGGTSNVIAMRQNTTATMIWNGSDWTAAGASSSTTLQAAYDNTLISAGGAEIVLNNTASSDGLTVRNNSTNAIIGGILEVQTAIGSNLFSVNNNATEYASNGGAETPGASSATFPANTWAASPNGGTVTRYTTAGSNVATGQASVSVATTTSGHGAANTLSTTLTPNLKYTVSYAVRGATSFETLDTVYSRDGTNTSTTSCATASTATSGIWTRISCTFTAPSSGITSSNAILISQSDSTSRTFYIDNLSVTVSADVNHAADGSVDDSGNFSTNWTAAPAGGTVTRDTSTIYDTSASAKVVTTTTAHHGMVNNLSITPQISTQYLVSLYARSSNSFSDLTIRYSRDGGTNFASCTDYNTQTISTTGWTKVTCLFTTDGTTATNPDLVISQGSATARTFYIDALSVTLNTNNASNVQIGGGNEGGPTTLFTLDRASSAPIAANNDAYLGSMYYDTTTGRIQCYEADGWGACGSAPDNIVNLNPEYAGAVLNGTGVGTMTADFCGNGGGLSVNTDYCDSGEARNYYRWTSPQATQQTYSIYVTYQLPASFKDFSSDDTVQLTARRDSSNAAVTYEMFRVENGSIYQCGSGETTVTTTDDTWETVGINGNESTGCGFTTSSASAFIIFKINLKANSNANAYVGTLSFTTTGR